MARDLDHLAAVFDATPVGVALFSTSRRLAHANPVLCGLVGRSRVELSGTLLEELVDPADAASVRAKLSDIWAGRRNHMECYVRGRAPGGATIWLRAYIAAVYGRGGEPGYFVAQIFNFAGRSDRDEQLRRLANDTPVMLWLTDELGFPRLGNRMAFEFVGVHQPSGDLGEVWADAIHPADLAAAQPRLAGLIARHQPFDFIARSQRRDGQWRWLHHRAEPIFDASDRFEGYAGASVDVTDSEQTRRDLYDSQQLFAGISEAGPLAVLRTDPEGRITYFNGRWAELMPEHETELGEFGWQDILAPEYVDRIVAAGQESIETRTPFHLRVRAREPRQGPDEQAGSEFWGELRGAPIFSADDEHLGFTATLIDVSDAVVASHRADRLAQVLDASSDLVLLARPSGPVTYANDAAVETLGVVVEPGDERGSFLWDLLDRESTDLYYDAVETMLRKEGVWRGELTLRGKGNRPIPVSALFIAHKDEAGRIESISAVARDITELKDAEQRLRHLATHDVLTGLPNRALLYDRLEQALARYHRLGHGVALLFCDLDKFKPVNDELGHDAGDAVLREIADRIRNVVRATDTAARVGGDEFVVLIEGVEDLGLLYGVANRLIESIREPVELDDEHPSVGVSIGLVLAGGGRDDVDTLMRLADRAMYQAKAAGRGRVQLLDGPF